MKNSMLFTRSIPAEHILSFLEAVFEGVGWLVSFAHLVVSRTVPKNEPSPSG